jgi:hypothetical protein
MPTRSASARPQLPTKWLLGLIGCLLVYGLVQPTLNARLGWSLPSVASLVSDEPSPTAKGSAATAPPPPQSTASPQSTGSSTNQTTPAASQEAVETVEDYLKENPPGSEDYLSPGGLRYTRGSEEGHRLKHVAKHLEDQPDRPGKHGVFEGDMLQVLRLLDEAFERSQRGDRGTRQTKQDRRTVHEVTFDQVIGYVGGQDGGRNRNPPAKRVRLVVEGNRVITAFPF